MGRLVRTLDGCSCQIKRATHPNRLAALALAAFTVAAVWPPTARAGDPAPDVAAQTQIETSGFVFKSIPVDEQSARTGAGQSVSLGGNSVMLRGEEVRVGDTLRAPAGQAGHVRILSVVPAIQTPTCEQQTHYLSERSGDLGDSVELVTISVDAPEVQQQFAREAAISNVTFVSDAGDAAFGQAHGLLIEKPAILARAVLVVDADDVVRYIQVVPEVAHMPDMEAAFRFARGLVDPTR